MKLIAILLLTLSACGKTPKENLRDLGRPNPIQCVNLSTIAVQCIDGGGLSWVCDHADSPFQDSNCIRSFGAGLETHVN